MRRLAALALLVAAPLSAGKEPLTVERIFAEPPLEGRVPRQVQWLPGGESFSYLDCQGVTDDTCTALVVEDAGHEGRRQVLVKADLTPCGQGAEAATPVLDDYVWAPSGEAVVLQGDGELFLVTLAGKGVKRLTATPAEEENPAFAPDGRWLAFVRDNDVYALELGSGREVKVSRDGGPHKLNGVLDWVYEEELAGPDTRALVWSPDSTTLAYITLDEIEVPEHPITDLLPVHPTTRAQRYPKAGDPNPVVGLAVVEVAPRASGAARRKELVWKGANAPYLARFGFTPESKRVWFQLLDRPQQCLELGFSGLGDETVTTRVVDEDAAWINLHDDLRFLADGRMLWSSERDGWRHLYLVPPGSGEPLQLTRGAWEVVGVEGVDEAGGFVYFTTTEKSPLERHLYRVRLDGRDLERLTSEEGTHSLMAAPGCSHFLDTYSRLDRPRALRLLDKRGKLVRPVASNEHPPVESYQLGHYERVSVKGSNGQSLQGMLLKPENFDATRRYPVVVYTYGGPHAQVTRDAWGGRNELFHHYLASRGILVFSLDNRGSAARGRAFERALLRRFGRAELEDQLAGVAWLRTQPFVAADRIGIWGWSYGGFMTTYAMTNAPDVFRAGAAVAPVTDWRLYDSIYTERYLKLPSDNPDGYRDSSPVTRADQLSGSLLLIHGTGDDNVHWQNTLAFVDRLYKAGKPYDLQLYANKDHGIKGQEAQTHLYRRIAEHFLRHLKDGVPEVR